MEHPRSDWFTYAPLWHQLLTLLTTKMSHPPTINSWLLPLINPLSTYQATLPAILDSQHGTSQGNQTRREGSRLRTRLKKTASQSNPIDQSANLTSLFSFNSSMAYSNSQFHPSFPIWYTVESISSLVVLLLSTQLGVFPGWPGDFISTEDLTGLNPLHSAGEAIPTQYLEQRASLGW